MKLLITLVAASAMTLGTSVSNGSSNAVYFVFAEPPPRGRDAFVLPLTQSNDIAFVRSWLRDTNLPPGTPITPVFLIAPGSDGINRDYLTVGAPQWSWHVVEFIGFSGGVSGVIGSTPTYVEDHLDEWMARNRGLTAFFQVPLFELLPRPDPVVSANLGPAGLGLSWTDLGVHYTYTVETATTVDSSNWAPVSSGVWPATATNWLSPAAVTNQFRFYRVKAQLKNP